MKDYSAHRKVCKFVRGVLLFSSDGDQNISFVNGKVKIPLDEDGSALKFLEENYPFCKNAVEYKSDKFNIYTEMMLPLGVETFWCDDFNDEYFRSNNDVFEFWGSFEEADIIDLCELDGYKLDSFIEEFVKNFPHVIPEGFELNEFTSN